MSDRKPSDPRGQRTRTSHLATSSSSSSSDPEQHPTPKSFDEVLASATDSSAYRPQGDDFGDEAVGDGVSGIKLDVRRLAEMVECIPLPERLGVSGDLFLPEQVAEFERIAKQRLKSFDERVKSIATSEIYGDRATMSEAEKDLNKVKSALKSFVPRVDISNDENNDDEDDDDDEDEDGLNPHDIVDWLDKVLAK